MPVQNNPIADPKAFARAYGEAFESAVTDAAGKDGRLSTTEAKQITEGYGTVRPFAAPIESFFDGTRQSSVGAQRMTRIATERAEAEAEKAVGSDGSINPRCLPGDLAQIYLRFEKTVPARGGDLSIDELTQKAQSFLEDKIAPARGWDQLEIYDWGDATNDWFGALKFSLHHDNPKISADDLVKIDFAGGYGDPDQGRDFSVGIAMDRRSGKVLELYIGREGASSPDDL